jgi:tetratricopeptide (TPR) repeat protein
MSASAASRCERSPLEESTETLPPVARSEEEQDRLDALAHFGAGRMAQQRNDLVDALRSYQRAARLDPAATPVLREIVPLAFSLDRPGVAVRYALLAVEKEPTDPALMRRLAAFVSEQGENEQALRLYEKTAELFKKSPEKSSPMSVLMSLEMGRLYFLEKRYDLAAQQFAAVMKALDSPAEFGLDETARKAILGGGNAAYRLFAEAFLEAGRAEDALAAYQQAEEVQSDASQFSLGKARVEFLQGDIIAAEKTLQKCLENPKAELGTAPYQLLDQILAKQDKSIEVVPRLAKLGTGNHRNIALGIYLAEKYQEASENDKAAEIYRELLRDDKDGPQVEAYQGLASIYAQQKRTKALLALMGKAAALTGSLDLLGKAGEEIEANKEVVSLLLKQGDAVWNDKPENVLLGERLALAELALADEKWEAADAWFDRAMQVRTERKVEPVLAWGFRLLLANRHQSAARAFQRILDEKLLPGDNAAAHYYLAGALEMEGKTEEALRFAREGARLQKDSPQFAARAAWILYHAKRYDEAKAEYLKLLEQFDSDHDSSETREVLRDARLVLSNIAVQQNEMSPAEEWLEQILDEYPQDIGALNDLGYLYADQGKRLQRALKMTQQAVKAEPENPAYRDSLGWALYRLGQFEAAIAELQRAAELDEETDGTLQDHLGDAFRAAGQEDAAKEAYQKAVVALEKAQDKARANEVRKKIAEDDKGRDNSLER